MTEEAGEKKQEEIKRVVHTYPLIRVCCDFTSMCVDSVFMQYVQALVRTYVCVATRIKMNHTVNLLGSWCLPFIDTEWLLPINSVLFR